MKFRSTRGRAKEHCFEEALFSPGYMSDGGLLMPETVPSISLELLRSWRGLSLPEVCKQVLPYFIDESEVCREDLAAVIDEAYSRLPLEQVAALSSFPNGLQVLELGNTRTLAFKDLSMFIMGRLLCYFLKKRKHHVTILVGTSGDTGPSAIESVRGLDWIDIVVLFPKGYCMQVQELQMTTACEDNVHVFAVNGSSDDVDVPIKAVCLDQDFKESHHLCTMNSINMARVLGQVVAYFYGYLKVCRSVGEVVEIVVPTGAAGNVTGGCIAHHMGLPIRLVCAVNSNDVIHRMLTTGLVSRSNKVIKTHSVAMDIQNPYNIERLLYMFSGQDTALVSKLMGEYESAGETTLPDQLLKKMQEVLSSFSCGNDSITKTMQRCWRDHSYLICPHSAVAASYFFHKLDSMGAGQAGDPPTLCFASAHPAKFPEALQAAGLEPAPTPAVQRLSTLPTRCTQMARGQDWEQMLRGKIAALTERAGLSA